MTTDDKVKTTRHGDGTTRRAPRDVRPGDVLALDGLDADLRVVTTRRRVESIESVGHGRYRLRLDGEAAPRYVPARSLLEVARP